MAWAIVASAQDASSYPSKPIRVILGAAPGSNTDLFFRIVSPSMGATIGQQLIPDYRAGDGGVVGATAVARAAPDGYTLGAVSGGFTMQPALAKNLPYDPLRDFTPLGLIADVPSALVINPQVAAKNVKELIELARAQPGKLNYGSTGRGTNAHLAGAMLNLLARVDIVHVPYKNLPGMVIEVMSGQVQLAFPSIPSVLEQSRSGRLRMLAQTGKVRAQIAPDIPTMEEAGVSGFLMNSGFGLIGPANLPRGILDKVNAALVKALREPANRKIIIDNAAEPMNGAWNEHEAFNRAEVARWITIAKQAGIPPE